MGWWRRWAGLESRASAAWCSYPKVPIGLKSEGHGAECFSTKGGLNPRAIRRLKLEHPGGWRS